MNLQQRPRSVHRNSGIGYMTLADVHQIGSPPPPPPSSQTMLLASAMAFNDALQALCSAGVKFSNVTESFPVPSPRPLATPQEIGLSLPDVNSVAYLEDVFRRPESDSGV